MDCKDFQLYGSAYIDNMLSKEEELDFKNHIKKCTACKIAFENLKIVVESTNMIEKVELPGDFSNELHEKLQSVKKYKPKSTLLSKSKILSSVAAMLLILVLSLSLANIFLNYKKGTDFYAEIDDAVQEKKNINIYGASDETEKKTLGKTDNEEPITDLRTAPADDNKIKGNIPEKAQEDVAESSKEKNNEDTGSVKRSNDNEKSTVNKNVQSPSNEKNSGKIVNSIVILTLVTGIGILIYKVPKR